MTGKSFLRVGGMSAAALKEVLRRIVVPNWRRGAGPGFEALAVLWVHRLVSGKHKSQVEQGGEELGSQRRRLNDLRDLDFRYEMHF